MLSSRWFIKKPYSAHEKAVALIEDSRASVAVELVENKSLLKSKCTNLVMNGRLLSDR